MDRLRVKLKKILNKDVTSLLNKYKIPLVSISVVVVLACIGLIVTYAFYQVVDTKPIIGGSTTEISDLDVRIMAEERDVNGYYKQKDKEKSSADKAKELRKKLKTKAKSDRNGSAESNNKWDVKCSEMNNIDTRDI